MKHYCRHKNKWNSDYSGHFLRPSWPAWPPKIKHCLKGQVWKCSARRRAHDFACLSSLKVLCIFKNSVEFTLSQALEKGLADLTTNLSVYFLFLLCEPHQRGLRYYIYLWKSITKAAEWEPNHKEMFSQNHSLCVNTFFVGFISVQFHCRRVNWLRGRTNGRNSLKRLLKDPSGQNWIVNWTKSAELNEQTSIMMMNRTQQWSASL